MSRNFAGIGNSDGLYHTNVPFTSLADITMGGWIKMDGNNTVVGFFMGVNFDNEIGGGDGTSIAFEFADTTIRILHDNVAWRGSGSSLGTTNWHHVVTKRSGSGDTSLYVDGSLVETPAGNPVDLVASDFIIIGGNINNAAAATGNINGKAAECALWNVGLSDKEIGALARGASPLFIRPGSLQGYWPVFGVHSPELDHSSLKQSMTIQGTIPQAAHAPVARHLPFAG